MRAALGRAAEGEFAAVVVAGESGVGKSRLLNELTSAAEHRGARVLGGDCVSYSEGELPYGPVRSSLRGLVRELDPATMDELLGPGRDELARLVPELGAPGPVAAAEWVTGEPVAQAALFELVAGVLARLAAVAPDPAQRAAPAPRMRRPSPPAAAPESRRRAASRCAAAPASTCSRCASGPSCDPICRPRASCCSSVRSRRPARESASCRTPGGRDHPARSAWRARCSRE